jgi:hypothetical protein
VDNIRMDLGEVGWGDVDWIGLAQDRNRWRAFVNSVLNLWVPWNAGKLSSGLTSSGLSGSAQLHRVSLSFCLLRIFRRQWMQLDVLLSAYFSWHYIPCPLDNWLPNIFFLLKRNCPQLCTSWKLGTTNTILEIIFS